MNFSIVFNMNYETLSRIYGQHWLTTFVLFATEQTHYSFSVLICTRQNALIHLKAFGGCCAAAQHTL